ncbi:MAG: pantetheine-phosphate adenylyltransferase [Bacteroidaceae bacterium]|nr:pantetheine-phosphate adenylyltransferase [Bacteroidaceae bacterium]
MRRAIFPGTFDPFTIGHDDIVKRALTFMDEVVIAIGINRNKCPLSSPETRAETIRSLYANEPRIRVEMFEELTTDFMKRIESRFIIRGIRSVKDFEYEESMADINKQLADVETIVLFCKPELANISSSLIRELKAYGKDVSRFLPTIENHKN